MPPDHFVNILVRGIRSYIKFFPGDIRHIGSSFSFVDMFRKRIHLKLARDVEESMTMRVFEVVDQLRLDITNDSNTGGEWVTWQ